MRKLSKIVESVWSDMEDRGTGDIIKKEDGTRVHTCLGVDIILKDPGSDYNKAINYILNHYNDENVCGFNILNIRDVNYSTEELSNIRKWLAPYTYMIYEGGHGTDLMIDFYAYSDLEEYGDEILDYISSEEDYISICKGIATKFKEVGKYIEYVPDRSWIYSNDRDGNTSASKYQHAYSFELISENDYYTWSLGNEHLAVGDFIDDICNKFIDIEGEDFIGWSYNNYGSCINIPINYMNLIHLKEYIEYTNKWFE